MRSSKNLCSVTPRAFSIETHPSERDFQDDKAKAEPVSRNDRNLERFKWPTFNGDKTKFESFWATFESIVDHTDEPAKYKMIQFKTCLEGKAGDAISRLGFSEEAYEEAKSIWW